MLALAVMYLVPPERLVQFSCPFLSLTGYSCMTSGLTRSIHSALHGEFWASLRFHLMGPVVLAGTLLVCARALAVALTGRQILSATSSRFRRGAAAGLLLAWTVYWLARLAVEMAS
jgi:hypothetical protein